MKRRERSHALTNLVPQILPLITQPRHVLRLIPSDEVAKICFIIRITQQTFYHIQHRPRESLIGLGTAVLRRKHQL